MVLVGAAEAHHPFDARPVVPGAVEEHDLAGRRQLGDVALEVPLCTLAFGRRGQGDDAGDAGVEVLRHSLDRAALAGGIAPLEHHDQALALGAHPLLDPDHLRLQPEQLAFVQLFGMRPLAAATFPVSCPLAMTVSVRRRADPS